MAKFNQHCDSNEPKGQCSISFPQNVSSKNKYFKYLKQIRSEGKAPLHQPSNFTETPVTKTFLSHIILIENEHMDFLRI